MFATRMTRFRLIWIWPLVCIALVTSACEDPSNVGIGLVDDQGAPTVVTVEPSSVETTELSDITGNAQRVLAGQVDDPLVGTVMATGYIDYQGQVSSTVSDLRGAQLELVRDYIYGDTTAQLSLTVLDMAEEWDAVRADTTLATGDVVTTFTFNASDSLVVVPLPESWIARHDTTLRSETFAQNFHGLALQAASSGAVVGFDARSSVLRVFAEEDTTLFQTARTFTGVTRSAGGDLPPNRLLVQDGAGPTVALTYEFDQETLQQAAVNGAFFRFFADTTVVQEAPANFHRPLLRTVQLMGVKGDDEVILAQTTVGDDGIFRFSDPSLRAALQEILLGTDAFDRFKIGVPLTSNTIDVVLVYDLAEEDQAPEAVLTVSPTE